jgi:phosphohistidine phosphatase
MNVLIVRHAIAFKRDPSQWPDDHLRPLTPDGEKRLRREAKGLSKVVPSIDLVLSSPWARAWQTAEILHKVAGWPAPVECQALEGHRSPRGVLSVLKQHKDAGVIALVGHEPQTQELASYLLTGDAARVTIEFKKAGAALLQVDEGVRAGTARLIWALPPRLLRALA